MFRRSTVSAFALVVAFALGMMLSNRPAMVSAQPAGHGKCVGVAVQTFVVYRAFEDGTVETVNLGQEDVAHAKWTQLGK
jgi:hypothetical protein